MAVDERARRHLHERLDAVLGVEAAGTLREELAVVGRDQGDLRTELRTGLADVRTDIADVRAGVVGLQGEVAELRTELRTGLADLRVTMSEQFERYGRYLVEQAQRTDAQTRLLVFSMFGSVMTVAAIAFAAARLS